MFVSYEGGGGGGGFNIAYSLANSAIHHSQPVRRRTQSHTAEYSKYSYNRDDRVRGHALSLKTVLAPFLRFFILLLFIYKSGRLRTDLKKVIILPTRGLIIAGP